MSKSARVLRAAQGAFIIGLASSVIPNGSVMPPQSHVGVMIMAVALLPVVMLPLRQPDLLPLLRGTLLTLIAIALVGLAHVWPQHPDGWTHPVWADLAGTLPTTRGYLSVNPSRSFAALPTLLLPLLVFCGALILSQHEGDARRLWLLLAMLGGSIVALSIVLELLFAGTHFFARFPVGAGSFSGVFVNRNVAAAFFAMAAFALVGALGIVTRARADHARAKMPRRAFQPDTVRFIVVLAMSLALFVCVIAIILTRSRAGALLSLPFLALCCLFFLTRKPGSKRDGGRFLRRGAMTAVLSGGLALGLLAAFGEPVLSRLDETPSGSRPCAYAATWQAIRDNPLWGTGPGTFADVFPRYRDSDCMGTNGVWHRAHSSFLELFLTMGLPSIIVLAAGYFMIGKALLRGLRRRRHLRAIPLVTLCLVIYATLHSAVDFPLQIPGVANYFFALLGCGCAFSIAPRHARRHRRGRRQGRCAGRPS